MTSAGMPASSPSRCLASLRSHSTRAVRSSDSRVFAMALGVSLHDQGGRGLDSVRREQVSEPRVHMGEQPVLVYGKAPRMVVHHYRVIGAQAAAVEGMAADRVALELLPAAITDHQSCERVAGRLSPPDPGVSTPPSGCDSVAAGVAWDERLHAMPRRVVHDGLVGLHRGGHQSARPLPLLSGDVAERRSIVVQSASSAPRSAYWCPSP